MGRAGSGRSLAAGLLVGIAAGALPAGCAQDRGEQRASTRMGRAYSLDAGCPVEQSEPWAAVGLPDAGAAAPGARAVFAGAALAPPASVGAVAWEGSGCLGTLTEAEGARYPLGPTGQPGEVRVNPLAGGLIVTHALAHPCCLKAVVTATVERGKVVVFEDLAGLPCRCRCASTVRTAVGLAPGRYALQVDLEEPGASRHPVFEEMVTIAR